MQQHTTLQHSAMQAAAMQFALCMGWLCLALRALTPVELARQQVKITFIFCIF